MYLGLKYIIQVERCFCILPLESSTYVLNSAFSMRTMPYRKSGFQLQRL